MYIKLNKVGYSQSDAIIELFTKKFNAKNLLRHHSTVLIRAAKSMDKVVIGVKILECWYKLKVDGMPLIHYLEEEKMELFH